MTTPDALWEVEWSLAVAAAEAASFTVTTQQSHEGSSSDPLCLQYRLDSDEKL